MIEEFVTTEIAKKLKEKGYPLLKVRKQNGNPFMYDLPEEHPDWQNCDAYYIPTIYQTLKWLREEKRIEANGCYDNDEEGWMGYVCEMDIPDLYAFHALKVHHKSYEEATLSAIEYVLNNNLI
jgi:hypothetical protein